MAENSFSPRTMAWNNLGRRPFRTAGLAGIVALFTFILFGGMVFNANLSRGLGSLAGHLGADPLIVPYGYEKETQAALLRGEPSTFYLKYELLNKVRQAAGVVQATPQFFLASLSASWCTAKVQIIGYGPETDFLIHPWTEANQSKLEKGRVVVGSRIITEAGGEVTFFDVNYVVAAKMEPTAMGFDTSVFVSLDDVYDLMKTSGLAEGDLDKVDTFISSIAVKTDPAYPIRDVGNELMRLYAIDYSLDLVTTKNMISDISLRLKSLSAFVWALAAILWILALIIMSIVFSATLNERKRELSLLRILGATRSWLERMILLEVAYIGFGGALAGLAAAAPVIFPFSSLIFQSIDLLHLGLTGLMILGYALTALMLAGAAGPLTGLYSVLSITSFDIYQTWREGE